MNAALSKADPFAMVCLRSHSTGLRNNVWLGSRRHARHSARVLVQMDHRTQFDLDDLATISVEDDPPRLLEGQLSAADLAAVQRVRAVVGEELVFLAIERELGFGDAVGNAACDRAEVGMAG